MNVLMDILWYLFLIGIIYIFGLPLIIIGIYVCLGILAFIVCIIVFICVYLWELIKNLFRRK